MSTTLGERVAPAKLQELTGTVVTDHAQIYPIATSVDPRTANIVIYVNDKADKPVAGAYVAWSSSLGRIGESSLTTTDEQGWAWAQFYSETSGLAKITAKVSKEGYKPLELQAEVEVLKNELVIQVVNSPPEGEIYVNEEAVGVGKAQVPVRNTGIYYVRWGQLDGYVPPEPAKLYCNIDFTTAPIVVEGIYRKVNEAPEEVKLTAFVMITYDERTGIPNPLPGAGVELSDGQTGVADLSGRVEFMVKPHSTLTVKASHPDTWGVYHEIEVKVGNMDKCVNLDFGPSFGGEESVDVTFTKEEEACPVEYEDDFTK